MIASWGPERRMQQYVAGKLQKEIGEFAHVYHFWNNFLSTRLLMANRRTQIWKRLSSALSLAPMNKQITNTGVSLTISKKLMTSERAALKHELMHDCKMTKNAAVNCFGEQYAPIDLSLLKSCQPVHHIVMVQKKREGKPEGGKRQRK